MKISPKGIARIKAAEACRLDVYEDQSGYLTVGVGHLLVDTTTGKPLDDEAAAIIKAGSITQEQCDDLLARDLEPAERAVNLYVHPPAGRELTQDQYDSLVSFVFNEGPAALHSSTLLYELNAGAPNSAIRAELMRWVKRYDDATKQLVTDPDLVKRRQAEAAYWPMSQTT